MLCSPLPLHSAHTHHSRLALWSEPGVHGLRGLRAALGQNPWRFQDWPGAGSTDNTPAFPTLDPHSATADGEGTGQVPESSVASLPPALSHLPRRGDCLPFALMTKNMRLQCRPKKGRGWVLTGPQNLVVLLGCPQAPCPALAWTLPLCLLHRCHLPHNCGQKEENAGCSQGHSPCRGVWRTGAGRGPGAPCTAGPTHITLGSFSPAVQTGSRETAQAGAATRE
ncbi:hypothetical protein H8959_001032 [Pygathrix nigripes]